MFLHLSLFIFTKKLRADYIWEIDGCHLVWSLLFASFLMNNLNIKMHTSVIWLALLKNFAGGGGGCADVCVK